MAVVDVETDPAYQHGHLPIPDWYVCPECGYGHCKPFGEIKDRPIFRCKRCHKIVKMKMPLKEVK